LFGVLALGLWAAGSSVNKLSTYGFVGRSGDAALIVDMDVARYRGSEKYIPVLIWLGHTDNKTLYADRSSFTLTDPKGDKIPLASSQEVTKDYGPTLISNDYTYIRRMPNYGSMVYLANRPIRSVAFFPNPSGAPGILYDNVELPNRTYFWALLYFANPAGKDGGQYTLTYNDPKSHTLIEVPFTIPWQK
jgi:hypothetical protein